MIRILLVDSHGLVRAGLRRILEDARGVRVVGEVDDAPEASALLQREAVDIAVVDVRGPGLAGLAGIRELRERWPALPLILLTPPSADPYPSALLESGAAGFISKGCSVEEFLRAVEKVHAGERYVGSDIAQQLAHSLLPGGERSPFDTLSRRELQVMSMLTRGHNVQKISQELHLSPKTVNTYRYRLYGKLGIDNDVELTRLAIRYGMTDTANGAAAVS